MIKAFVIVIAFVMSGLAAQAEQPEVQAAQGDESSSIQALRNAGAEVELTEEGVVKWVKFSGDNVQPASLAPLKDLPALDILYICEVKDPKPLLAELATLPQPLQLLFFFVPIEDADIEVLKEFESVAILGLYGTSVTRNGVGELKGALPQTLIEYRTGAVLGIRLKNTEGAAAVVDVVGPAKEAGIQPGDVITKLNDKPCANCHELLESVSKLPIGEKVRLTILRDGTSITKEITLGRFGTPHF